MDLEILLSYQNNSLSILPTKGKVSSLKTWKAYQAILPSEDDIKKWYNEGRFSEVAVITGKVSGNLEALDFDNKDKEFPAEKNFQEFKELVENSEYSDLWNKLVVQKSQSGGFHIFYRADNINGNKKLAEIDREGLRIVLIETRGIGGYILIEPSPNYKFIQGNIEGVSQISNDERNFLHDVAKSFDKIKIAAKQVKIEKKYIFDNETPGNKFNENSNNLIDVLERNGWKIYRSFDSKIYWQRPHKERGYSAVSDYWNGKYLFVNFSTSTNLETEKGYTAFSLLTELEFNGDYKESAKWLFKNGYGKYKFITYTVNGNSATDDDFTSEAQESNIDINKFRYTDIGNAERLIHYFGNRIKWNNGYNAWFIWNDAYWKEDNNLKIFRYTDMTLQYMRTQEMAKKTEDAKQVFAAFIDKSSHIRNIRNWLDTTKFKEEVVTTQDDYDKNGYLLNFKNGTLNLKTQEFYKHRKEDLITKYIAINYNEKALAPNWTEFLETIFLGDTELIEYVQMALGMSLIGLSLEEVLFFAYGSGGNGKSVFFKIIRNIFNDYMENIPVSILMGDGKGGDNNQHYAMTKLAGKRMILTDETEDTRLKESTIKMITGNDSYLQARNPHGGFFKFKPVHTLWMFGNHKPSISGNDDGIWRRIKLIPFRHKFTGEKKLPQEEVMKKFEKEYEGIAYWIVLGAIEYLNRLKLTDPEVIKKEIDIYRSDNDILEEFVRDCLMHTGNFKDQIEQGSVYKLYIWYLERKNEKVFMRKKSFYERIESKGYPRIFGNSKLKYFTEMKINQEQAEKYRDVNGGRNENINTFSFEKDDEKTPF